MNFNINKIDWPFKKEKEKLMESYLQNLSSEQLEIFLDGHKYRKKFIKLLKNQ